MKRLLWFTQTNINYRNQNNLNDKSIDLTKFIKKFTEDKLWEKPKYRDEYLDQFEKEDLESIKSIKIHIHNEGYPFSNLHKYENLISRYIGDENLNQQKIISSGIGEASKIAVVDVEYISSDKLIKNLSYEEEKDIDLVVENMGDENIETWQNQNKIKSIVCEFIQFLMFNLHLNFLTEKYDFNFSDKPKPTGLSIISEDNKFYFENDKIELLSHYILMEDKIDNLNEIMDLTSAFWCRNHSSIHFFLDALKGSFMTATNFIKLVFTFESFFNKNISNDYMTLVAPLLVSKNIKEMKEYRMALRKCFQWRNEIVHGNKVLSLRKDKEMTDLFFKLKNLITLIFYLLINKNLYRGNDNPKLNHELIFQLLPNGIN